MRNASIAYYMVYYVARRGRSAGYQNAANPRFEARLDAHALAYALEHTDFFGGFMASQGAKSARQGTHGCACAPQQFTVFRCAETTSVGSENEVVRSIRCRFASWIRKELEPVAANERDSLPAYLGRPIISERAGNADRGERIPLASRIIPA